MAVLKIEGVTHWSIPVNDLNEAEEFYGDLLGLTPKGRLGNNIMSCFNVGDHNILLCQRSSPVDGPLAEDGGVHHSFTVSPDTFNEACRVFRQRGISHRQFDLPGPGVLHRPRALLLRPQRQPAGIEGPDLEPGDAGASVRGAGERLGRDLVC